MKEEMDSFPLSLFEASLLCVMFKIHQESLEKLKLD